MYLRSFFELLYVTAIKLPTILKLIYLNYYWTFLMAYYKFFNYSLLDFFRKSFDKFANKPCLIGVDGQSYTFKQIDELTNQIANGVRLFIQNKNLNGATVAIITENTPMVVILWLSMYKIGLSSALINFNLKKDSLLFSLEAVNPFLVFYDKACENIVNEMGLNIPMICVDEFPKVSNNHFFLNNMLLSVDSNPPIQNHCFVETLLFIYTSGTTGLPKAAVIKSTRFFSLGITGLMAGINSKDILYITMPLYHVNSGILCVSSMFLFGCCLVVRKKFSTSSFVDDCLKYKVTGFNYVGELCRYLLAAPVHPNENSLNLRLALGNGLRQSIWNDLVKRFHIKQISEFYGSTEGNSGSINMDSTVGSCGFIPPIISFKHPLTLVKYDSITKEISRDHNGKAIKACTNEPGMAVVKITMNNPLKQFDGYTNSTETSKKIARNLFIENDSYFVTGDLMKLDKFGHLFFVDRTGDTFRWKGENVSTMEVESILMKHLSSTIEDALIFGVQVGNLEGKAGMAAIRPKSFFDFDTNDFIRRFISILNSELPVYSRPLFIRILKFTPTTSTLKFDKTLLTSQSFNPQNCSNDDIFYWNPKNKFFEILNANIYEQIISNKITY